MIFAVTWALPPLFDIDSPARWPNENARETAAHLGHRVQREARLPLELYRDIVCHTSTSLLCTLCLVSRMFRKEAERVLYHQVHLESYRPFTIWCETIHNNQRLADLVHELTLTTRWDQSPLPAMYPNSLASFTDALNSLRALQILRISQITLWSIGCSSKTFIGHPFRLHTLECQQSGRDDDDMWLPLFREQSSIQNLLICGPVLSNIAVSALRSTVNMLSRLSVQIRYPMRPFGMVRELLTVAREAPNLIFLALDIGFSSEHCAQEFKDNIEDFALLTGLEALLLTIGRTHAPVMPQQAGSCALQADSDDTHDHSDDSKAISLATFEIAQVFLQDCPSLARVAIRSVWRRVSQGAIPCFVRSDHGMAMLEGFDILTERSWEGT